MSKKTKKTKSQTKVQNNKKQESLLASVIRELNLHHTDYSMVGAGSHLNITNPFSTDEASKNTLVSFMVVDAATFLHITEHKGLIPLKHNGYDIATIPGNGPSGSGGISFVCAAKGLSIQYNSVEDIENFLYEMIDFSSMMNASVSLNIMAYLAAAEPTAVKFAETAIFDWVKEKLVRVMRQRDGQSYMGIFTEPEWIYRGIRLVNENRFGQAAWNLKTLNLPSGPVGMDDYYRRKEEEAEILSEKDEMCLELNRRANKPEWLSPSHQEVVLDQHDPQIYSGPIEPDEAVLARTPYDIEIDPLNPEEQKND